MKNFKNIFIVFLLLQNSLIFGQLNNEIKNEKSFIEVTGKSEMKIVPDEIYITITLLERQEGKEKITIESQENALKTAIQSLNIDLQNLYLADADANYVVVRWYKKDVISNVKYILKVNSAKSVAQIFEKLEELKIKNAYISKVDHSEIKKFEKETRVLAIKNAKEKADYLLQAIGEQTGKPIKVNEIIEGNPIDKMPGRSEFLCESKMSEYQILNDINKNDEIQFQKIIIKSDIYVMFEIK